MPSGPPSATTPTTGLDHSSEGGVHPLMRTSADKIVTTTLQTVQPLPAELAAMITEPSPVARVAPNLLKMMVTIDPPPSFGRSARTTKGELKSTKYINESYLSTVETMSKVYLYTSHLAYLAEVSTCCDTGIENVIYP